MTNNKTKIYNSYVKSKPKQGFSGVHKLSQHRQKIIYDKNKVLGRDIKLLYSLVKRKGLIFKTYVFSTAFNIYYYNNVYCTGCIGQTLTSDLMQHIWFRKCVSHFDVRMHLKKNYKSNKYFLITYCHWMQRSPNLHFVCSISNMHMDTNKQNKPRFIIIIHGQLSVDVIAKLIFAKLLTIYHKWGLTRELYSTSKYCQVLLLQRNCLAQLRANDRKARSHRT